MDRLQETGANCENCGNEIGEEVGYTRLCPNCEFYERADYEYDRMIDERFTNGEM